MLRVYDQNIRLTPRHAHKRDFYYSIVFVFFSDVKCTVMMKQVNDLENIQHFALPTARV